VEENEEEIEAVAEHQKIPKVETVEAEEDLSADQQPAVGYRNQRKGRTKDNVV
jgi:hypothetical protein